MLLKKVAPMSATVKKAALELAQELKTNDTRDKEPELKCAKTDDTDGLDDEPKRKNAAMVDNDEDCDHMDGTDDVYDAEMDADPQFGDATGAAGNMDMGYGVRVGAETTRRETKG